MPVDLFHRLCISGETLALLEAFDHLSCLSVKVAIFLQGEGTARLRRVRAAREIGVLCLAEHVEHELAVVDVFAEHVPIEALGEHFAL